MYRMKGFFLMVLMVLFLFGNSVVFAQGRRERVNNYRLHEDGMEEDMYEVATIGGGCFWCVEAVFEPIEGVIRVVSGYAGGSIHNPSYEQVIQGRTGHAEVVQVYFDSQILTYDQILSLFFKAHNPTTLNQQGYDVGTQYRSIILTHSDKQKTIAEETIVKEQEKWRDPIVTEVTPFTTFYEAEAYHQDFYAKNPNYGYCVAVIRPKLEKLDIEGRDTIKILDLGL